VPASRSRTERWRDCLHQIYERSGGLDVAIAGGREGAPSHLLWRVRVLGLSEAEIVVECPSAAGQTAPRMNVAHVGAAVLQMANLPLDANVQFMTIMATKMPFVGRG